MKSFQFRKNHFAETLPPDEARELFAVSVHYVEIETSSYCNRKCWFCPNATMPERQNQCTFMGYGLYRRIINDLAAVDYRGMIQFGRYNEPLYSPDILTRITEARALLPNAILYTHTNGDFLTREYLDELRDAGLNEIALQTYLGNDDRWNDAKILERQEKQLYRLGLKKTKPVCVAPGLRYQYETDYPGMLVRIDARNFDELGTDRGGLVQIQQQRPRTAPCMVPFGQMYIDVTGDVMPCCNLRSDRPEHAAYSVCRLQDGHSIFDAFVALHGWRKNLMRFGPKGGPCATCRYDEIDVDESQAGELERLYQIGITENQRGCATYSSSLNQ